MQTKPNEHPGEEALERYSMGTLPEGELAPFEEHLLLCGSCQDQLAGIDDYVIAMRTSAARLEREEAVPHPPGFLAGLSRAFSRRGLTWAFAGVLLVLSITWLTVSRRGTRPLSSHPVAVFLQSARGLESPAMARVSGGRPIVLQVDPAELPTLPAYGLEIVDIRGGHIWESTVMPRDGRLRAEVPHSLNDGRYWVRLYRPAPSKELLREYGLEVR
jgi:hypothetical protein